MNIEHNKRTFEEARLRGSIEPMEVGEDYVVEDGRLVQIGTELARSRFYYPLAHPNVLTDFAKLEKDDWQSVAIFARRWGHLRHYSRSPKTIREKKISGDTLEFVWRQAGQVKDLLNLIHLRKNRDSRQLRKALDELVEVSEPDMKWLEYIDLQGEMRYFSRLKTYIILVRESEAEVHPEYDPDDPTINAAHEYFEEYQLSEALILEIINANLETVRVKLEGNRAGQMVRSYGAGSLLAVIYLHLVDAALGEMPYLRCDYCGNFYQQVHGRQRYCPSLTPGKQSSCSLRARMKRFRAKG